MSRPDDKLFKQFASSLRHKQAPATPPPVSPHKAKSKSAVSDIRDRWTMLYVEFDARSPTMTQVHSDIIAQDLVWRRHLVANKATLNEPRTLERDIVAILRKRGHPFCRLCQLFTDLFNTTYASQQMGLTVRSTKDAAELLARAVTDVRKFQQYMQVALLRRFPETDTRVGRECGRQAIQETLFPVIFHNLFEMYKRKNFYRDAVFAAKLAALEVISTSDMGVSDMFQLIPPDSLQPISTAIMFSPPVIDESRFKMVASPAPSPSSSSRPSISSSASASPSSTSPTAAASVVSISISTIPSSLPSSSSLGGLPIAPPQLNGHIYTSSTVSSGASSVDISSVNPTISIIPPVSASDQLQQSSTTPAASPTSAIPPWSPVASLSLSTSVSDLQSSMPNVVPASTSMPIPSLPTATIPPSSEHLVTATAVSSLIGSSGPSNFSSPPPAHPSTRGGRLFSPPVSSDSKTPTERMVDGHRLSLATRVSMPHGNVESKNLTQSPRALAIADSLMSSPLTRPSNRDLAKSLDALSSLSSLTASAAAQAGVLPPTLPSSESSVFGNSSGSVTQSMILPTIPPTPVPVLDIKSPLSTLAPAASTSSISASPSLPSFTAATPMTPTPSTNNTVQSSPFMVSSSPPVTLTLPIPTTPNHNHVSNSSLLQSPTGAATPRPDDKRFDYSPSMMPSLSMAINELGGFADPLMSANGARSFTDGNEDFPYQAACLSLRQLSQRMTPRDKLSCILVASQDLCTCVDNFYKQHDELKPAEQPCINADDLLSLCAYILIKSRLPYAISEAGFIEDFVGESLKMAMSGYYLATLQAAIELINGLDKDKLIANMEGVRSTPSLESPSCSRQTSRRGSRSISAATAGIHSSLGISPLTSTSASPIMSPSAQSQTSHPSHQHVQQVHLNGNAAANGVSSAPSSTSARPNATSPSVRVH